MRKIILALVASAALATPALANEARVEGRGGVIWLAGTSKGVAGVAAGYDFDLGSSAFVGGEVSADKVLTSGTKVAFGFTGRAGVKAGEQAKIFAAGGYTTAFCNGCDGQWHLGGGVNFDVAKNVYLTAEYRHFFKHAFTTNADAVVGGIGMKF